MTRQARVYSEVVPDGPNQGLRYWLAYIYDSTRPTAARRTAIRRTHREALDEAIQAVAK